MESIKPTPTARPLRTPSRGRVWLARLGLLLGSIVVALLIGEVAVRWLGVGPVFMKITSGAFRLTDNPLIRYEFLPGYHDSRLDINADSMRDRDYTAAKPEGVFRIACIGDSICEGHELPVEDSFVRQIDTMLNQYYAGAGRRFEVLNFGVPGYNAVQVMETLRVRALKYQPDVVVYALCVNDGEDYQYEFEVLNSKVTGAERQYFDGLRRQSAHLLNRSRLFLLGRYRWQSETYFGRRRHPVKPDLQFRHLRERTYADYYIEQVESPEGWGRIRGGLKRMAELCGAAKVSPYVVVFPVLLDMEDYPLQGVHRRIRDEATRQGLRTLDLLPAYQALARQVGEKYTLDGLHPNAIGHTLAAAAILRALLAGERALVDDASLSNIETKDESLESVIRLLRTEVTLSSGDTSGP
ncbi:MAG: SGNH/GDSL hydrolase family protein [Phycisphaerae bacterium]